MAKTAGKPPILRYLFLTVCTAILVAVFLINFLWASSSRSAFARLSSVGSSVVRLPPDSVKLSNMEGVNLQNSGRGELAEVKSTNAVNLSNYVDIIEHERKLIQLDWEEMAAAPVPRLDGSAIQIGTLLYVFAGYESLDHVHSHVDIYNILENKWEESFDMPKEMAHSHLGMATDGRYIYTISGQYGPQCRSPIASNFVLDTKTRKWSRLPSLPAPRYAPATQLWRGRLHVMGGSKEDRHEPGLEHWSLAVKDGKALESEWRLEIPIPRGGPHRACVVANDRLYVIGGQEGDFMAKPGSPIFKCARRKEVVYTDVYMLGDGPGWKQMPPMPLPDSHIEFAWVLVNNSIIIAGGTTEKHPLTKRMVLVGEIFQFDLNTLEWRVLGKMPCRAKTVLSAYWDGWLYVTSGQRDRGITDPSPKKVIGNTWRTKLDLSQSNQRS